MRYASLSGDQPGTSQWEGFDLLYFGGSNPNWYQGLITSTVSNNTNLNVVSFALTLTPNANSIIEVVFLHFAANQINSPLAVPAPGATPTGGGGIPSKALANELDATYTYILNKNLNVNLYAAYSAPGAGFKDLYSANGGSASGWWFIGTQFNFSY